MAPAGPSPGRRPRGSRRSPTPASSRLLDRSLDERLRDVDADGLAVGSDERWRAAGWCPRSRSRGRGPGRRARAGAAVIATSPCCASPATIRSRYLTKRSKSTPLQASVASSFSAATAAFWSLPMCLLHGHMVRRPGRLLHIRGDPNVHRRLWLLAALAGPPAEPPSSRPPRTRPRSTSQARSGCVPSASANERRAHQYVARQFRAAGLDVEHQSVPGPGPGPFPQRRRRSSTPPRSAWSS